MMNKRLTVSIFVGVMALSILFTGCDSTTAIIPEDIIMNATSANKESINYYGELKMEIYENDKKINDAKYKEWYKPINKKRTEVVENDKLSVVTFDGNKMITYMEGTNEALISSKGTDNIGDRDRSPKEKAIDELAAISKTHTVQVKGEEKVNGRDAYHLFAKPKEKDAIVGEADYWIDKDTWFITKFIINSGNIKFSTEYTKLDFKVDISDDMFTQTIPKDAKVINLDEVMKTKGITLEEASKKLDKKVLYFNGHDYKLDKVELLENNSKIGDEFNQVYVDEKGIEIFNLTVKRDIELNNTGEKVKLPNEKDTVVRGKKGSSVEEKAFKMIIWSEDGLNYSIFTMAPNFSMEQCKNVVEKLVVAQ